MAKILLVEDEVNIASFIERGLQEFGHTVSVAYNGADGWQLAQDEPFDLLVLDSPVIMLTALGTTDDIVKGLYAGADDYLVKPFSFQELEARITALLRRSKEKRTSELVCGDLILDCNTRRARRGDREMELTVKEYRLLEHFMNNQGVVLSRVNLLKHVWDKNFDTNTNVVDVYVNYLRTKIDKDYENKLIHTVVGLGYIMESH